jgi:hypothetical protein
MSALALPDLVTRIEAEHEAANRDARSALEHAVRCGELLAQAKASLEHGQWLRWIGDHLSFGERQAQKYLRLAACKAELANTNSGSDFTINGVLAALAEPRAGSDEPPEPEVVDEPDDEVFAKLRGAVPRERIQPERPGVTSLSGVRRFRQSRAEAIASLTTSMSSVASSYGRDAVTTAMSVYHNPDRLEVMIRDIGDVKDRLTARQPEELPATIVIPLAYLRTAPADQVASWLASQFGADDLALFGVVIEELRRLLAERWDGLIEFPNGA